jgi:hypothetical protein
MLPLRQLLFACLFSLLDIDDAIITDYFIFFDATFRPFLSFDIFISFRH